MVTSLFVLAGCVAILAGIVLATVEPGDDAAAGRAVNWVIDGFVVIVLALIVAFGFNALAHAGG